MLYELYAVEQSMFSVRLFDHEIGTYEVIYLYTSNSSEYITSVLTTCQFRLWSGLFFCEFQTVFQRIGEW